MINIAQGTALGKSASYNNTPCKGITIKLFCICYFGHPYQSTGACGLEAIILFDYDAI